MSKIIGIDLGTTNSCVAVIIKGNPQVIQGSNGKLTTPSMVAFNADGERLLGEKAKLNAVNNPESIIFSVKRLMGSEPNSREVNAIKKISPTKL